MGRFSYVRKIVTSKLMVDNTRFLIESPEHAILYTGDVRSEPFLINSLTENPYLQDYLSLHGHASRKTLDQIYLDTSAALSKGRLLSKVFCNLARYCL